jgi:hypothetical protein
VWTLGLVTHPQLDLSPTRLSPSNPPPLPPRSLPPPLSNPDRRPRPPPRPSWLNKDLTSSPSRPPVTVPVRRIVLDCAIHKLTTRVCPLDIGQDGQLGPTGFDVAHDFRSRLLRRRDDVSWGRFRCTVSPKNETQTLTRTGTWPPLDMIKIDWVSSSEPVRDRVIS